MAEPGRPPTDDGEVPERLHREVHSPGGSPTQPRPPERSYSWLWVILLLLVVGALAYYALSRGEPQRPELPSFEAPQPDLPEQQQPAVDVDVNVESPAPATEGAPEGGSPDGAEESAPGTSGAEGPAPQEQPDGGGAAGPD